MKRPFLCIAAQAVSLLLFSVCLAGEIESVSFEQLGLPQTKEEKVAVRSSKKATVTFSGGLVREYGVSFRTLMRTGDRDPSGETFGLLTDRDGVPINTSYAPSSISVYPDANTAFRRGGRYLLLTNLEGIPGGAYLTEFSKGPGGVLSPVRFNPVDFSPVGGTLLNCAGSKTPWDTHLGGEEDYNFDAFYFDPRTYGLSDIHIKDCLSGKPDYLCQSLTEMGAYLKTGITEINPYGYGYIIEVSPGKKGGTSVKKHYSMGKGTPEMALVMPDGRTAYMTDDGPYAGFYMYVADREKDLSSGTLYMARWSQLEGKNGGRARLEWVRLGHASDGEIREIIGRRPLFTDIFDVENPESCPEGFRLVRAGSPWLMCLRLRDGENGSTVSGRFRGAEEARKAAAFLEARKYGSYSGATSEFNKEEGLIYDPRKKALYVAISYIERSMEDNPEEPANHIRLERNRCGAVYEVTLGEASDASGESINTGFAGKEMRSMIAGRPLSPGERYSDENGCDPDLPANPDNLGIYGNILFIGEDSAYHLNNMGWAFDTEKSTLRRILTLPTGGELTGTFHRFDIDEKAYIFLNIQHPLKDVSMNASGKVSNQELLNAAGETDKRGYVGYILGLPSPDVRK